MTNRTTEDRYLEAVDWLRGNGGDETRSAHVALVSGPAARSVSQERRQMAIVGLRILIEAGWSLRAPQDGAVPVWAVARVDGGGLIYGRELASLGDVTAAR